MSLLRRVFLGNVVVVLLALVALVLTPATVSSPVRATELAVLALGVGALLATEFLLLRRAMAPLARLSRFAAEVDPLAPGARAPHDDSVREVREVADAVNGMLDRLEDERRQSARRMLAAEERERTRVARELHDEVGQVLTGVVLSLENARRHAHEPVRAEIEQAQEQVRQGSRDLRAIAVRLRPEALDDLGLRSALAAMGNEMRRSSHVTIDRDLDPAIPALDEDVELVIYRIAQESVTNAVRHGAPSRVVIRLAVEGPDLVLTVDDDGAGFAPGVPSGGGMRGMRERALLVGGRLEINTVPGAGTRVTLTLPLESAS